MQWFGVLVRVMFPSAVVSVMWLLTRMSFRSLQSRDVT